MKVLPDGLIKQFETSRLHFLTHNVHMDWSDAALKACPHGRDYYVANLITEAARDVIEQLLSTWQHRFEYASSEVYLQNDYDFTINPPALVLRFQLLVADPKEQVFSEAEVVAWEQGNNSQDFPKPGVAG